MRAPKDLHTHERSTLSDEQDSAQPTSAQYSKSIVDTTRRRDLYELMSYASSVEDAEQSALEAAYSSAMSNPTSSQASSSKIIQHSQIPMALPAEVRSMALERLRQLEGHLAASSVQLGEQQQDLEARWRQWWQESPTGCFDDSKDALSQEPPPVHDAMERPHLQNVLLSHLPIPRRATRPALVEQTMGPTDDRNHSDLSDGRRSPPIAAQHRSCPHAGCGYCSTTSNDWFNHVKACLL